MKFDVFDQETKTLIVKLEFDDIYSDLSVLNSLIDNKIINGKDFKVIRIHPELIIQQYDNDEEMYRPLCWIVVKNDEILTNSFVYRLENSDGKGPYTADRSINYLCVTNSRERGPHPDYDHFPPEALKYLGEIAFCAFLNENQLKVWFSESDLIELKKLGFEIVRKPAKKVWLGGHQVIFVP